jgi:DNA replication and repair protein RecF
VRLTSLSVFGWRNLESTTIDCDAPLVVVHGNNGEGKSNLLEAVSVLSTLKSFREALVRRWMCHGTSQARVSGTALSPVGTREISWSWVDGKRRLLMDESNVYELTQWFEVLRAVVFCPEDGSIIRGGPDQRRRFMDRAAFNANPNHLKAVTEYQKILAHKRALLQTDWVDPLQLDAFNSALARAGAAVIYPRVCAVAALKHSFCSNHEAIAGTGIVDLSVKTNAFNVEDGLNQAEMESCLLKAIQEKQADEISRGVALIGPHRDEMSIEIDGKPARNFASQGQARSLVLGLRLAELEFAHSFGSVPLFLLDDLTSELDQGRRRRLISVLRTLKGQVWITTTDPKYLGELKGLDPLLLHVQAGRISAEK